MDNCVRENKNKYVFAFMILLVELRLFDEVSVSPKTEEKTTKHYVYNSLWTTSFNNIFLHRLK